METLRVVIEVLRGDVLIQRHLNGLGVPATASPIDFDNHSDPL